MILDIDSLTQNYNSVKIERFFSMLDGCIKQRSTDSPISYYWIRDTMLCMRFDTETRELWCNEFYWNTFSLEFNLDNDEMVKLITYIMKDRFNSDLEVYFVGMGNTKVWY